MGTRISAWMAMLVICGMGTSAWGQDSDGVLERWPHGVLAPTVVLPSTARDMDTAVPVFDFQLVNPLGVSVRPLLLDGLIIHFGAGSAELGDLAGMSATLSGSGHPRFASGDSVLSTDDSDLVHWSIATGRLELGPGADAQDDADLLAIAPGDTVVVTVHVWMADKATGDGKTLTVSVTGDLDVVTDRGGHTDLMGSVAARTTTLIEQTAVRIVATGTSSGGPGPQVTAPTTATSQPLAVPVFQFQIQDTDDGITQRPTRIDGITIPLTLEGGMIPADVAGAMLTLTSSQPLDTRVFAAALGGDRQIDTEADPSRIRLVTVGNDLELRIGVDAGFVGTPDDGVADVLTLDDPNLSMDESAILTVSLWWGADDIPEGATLRLDLAAAGVRVDAAGQGSDVVHPGLQLPATVVSFASASSVRTTLTDPGDLSVAMALPSSAVDRLSAVDVFDFSIEDALGGQPTRIDSLTLPVRLSGGARFRDLAGVRLRVSDGEGIRFAHLGDASMDLERHPGLVHLDSIGPSLAHITFKGREDIDTTDATADLLEIADGAGPVTFQVAVWVDTSDLVYGATFTFALESSQVTLTRQRSDRLLPAQEVGPRKVSIALGRVADLAAVPTPVTLSSAAISGPLEALDMHAQDVFDFQICDPLDGVPMHIDGLRIPLRFTGGASISDIAGVRATVSGLAVNHWRCAGAGTAVIVSASQPTAIEIDTAASAIDIGSLVTGGATLGVDGLTLADGESATVTLALWLNPAQLRDSSAVHLSLAGSGIHISGTSSAVASGQLASGTAIIRATTLSDVPMGSESAYLANVHTGSHCVEAFAFRIVDPLDGAPTRVDRIQLRADGNGADADIVDVRVSVLGGHFAASADDNGDGILAAGDQGWKDSGAFPVPGQTITLGIAAADGDGVADLIEIADGSSVSLVVSVNTGGAATPGNTVGFEIDSASITVDGGDGPGETGSAMAAAQNLPTKTLIITPATTLLRSGYQEQDTVVVSSLATTAATAVAVYDFVITDAWGGSATRIDGLTLPVVLADVDFTDVAGVVVTTTGTFSAVSDDNPADNRLEVGDAGLELQPTADGMNILLGSAAAGVEAEADATAELLSVDGRSVELTVAVYVNASAAALDDGGTLTFNVSAANFTVDAAESEAFIPHQQLPAVTGKIQVTATRLAFREPTPSTLSQAGVSDTLRVLATDRNGNLDTDYDANIQVTSSAGTGCFSEDGSRFLAPGRGLSATPAQGVLSFFYRDGTAGSLQLEASSGELDVAELPLAVQPLSVVVSWTDPAVGDTTTTDSCGDHHRLQYTITTNDAHLLVEFWASQLDSLAHISPQNAVPLSVFNPDSSQVLGRLRNPTGQAYGPGRHGAEASDVAAGSTSQYVSTGELAAGQWFVYMVRADGDGISAGGDTLARSGALRILHYPRVIAFGLAATRDGRVDSATTWHRDSGGNTPATSIDVLLYAQDHDSDDRVRLYLSTSDTLTASSLISPDSTVFVLPGSGDWRTADVGDTLRYLTVTITDSLGTSPFFPRGTYYLYARVTDATDTTVVAFARARNAVGQQQSLEVGHAPYLRFSQPAAAVVDYDLVSTPRMTLAWNGTGAAGDHDLDDNATISLWFAPCDSTPTVGADTAATWMQRITGGLAEDPDGGANDQYVWELADFDGRLPEAGKAIRVWALLADAVSEPVFVASPRISFAPFRAALTLLNPPPGAVTEIRECDSYRLEFAAHQLSDAAIHATLRYFLSSVETGSATVAPSGLFTFASGPEATFPEDYNSFWISGADELHEGMDRVFDWTPLDDGIDYASAMSPPTVATPALHVYAVIDTCAGPIPSVDGRVLARAPGRIRITGLGATLAPPAVAASPSQASVAAGDTVRVMLRGNTNGIPVQGLQLYINVDSTQFALVDQDSVSAGIQPFGFAANYFLGTLAAQTNQLSRDSLYYKLDLDKRNLGAPADPTGEVIAHLDLVARSFTGSAELNWSLDPRRDPQRIPVFFSAGTVLGTPFTNPLAVFAAVSRGSISGFIPLQGVGRTTDSKLVTVRLRHPGSWLGITDTVFIHANDDSTALAGVQVVTGADGSFALTDIPPGDYELVVKAESYLAGAARVSVVNGQAITGIVPTRADLDAASDPGELLGGDLNGDNKIDTDDESVLNLAYGTVAADSSFSTAADIDDDGAVRLSDLLILAANLRSPLLTGVAPVYKPATGTAVILTGVPPASPVGERLDLRLEVDRATSLTAYSLVLEYDPQALRVLSGGSPALADAPAVRIAHVLRPGRWLQAEATKGGKEVFLPENLLATIQVQVLTSAPPRLRLRAVSVAHTGSVQEPLAVRATRPLPSTGALYPNSPNPFNPETRIRFDIPREGSDLVSLTIYNTRGQRVRSLLDAAHMDAGHYAYTWDGRDEAGEQVASGVYLYQLRSGTSVRTRRMVLMK